MSIEINGLSRIYYVIIGTNNGTFVNQKSEDRTFRACRSQKCRHDYLLRKRTRFYKE